MDLIIAVLIFLLAAGIFYYFTGHEAQRDQTKLKIEAQVMADKLASTAELGLVNGSSVDEQKLQQTVGSSVDDYAALKQKLGLQDDFCVVMLDSDGNLILLGNGTVNRAGFGNGNLTINMTGINQAVPCGGTYSS